MHPLNRPLSYLGLQINRIKKSSREFKRVYERHLKELKESPGEFEVFDLMYDDTGEHPQSYVDYECAFASRHIGRAQPAQILDIGSYRYFILGLLANLRVTTLDIRNRPPASENETVITCDAKALDFPDNSFDVVLSLCAVEHFGLGRYGDEFDAGADKKAFQEMIRVLKPGGRLIFSTTITRRQPALVFNAHRIYSLPMIRSLCAGLNCLEEDYFSEQLRRPCTYEQVTTEPAKWDVYLGCWEKPA